MACRRNWYNICFGAASRRAISRQLWRAYGSAKSRAYISKSERGEEEHSRCIQTFGSGGACESAQKPTAAQIEKSEHDQEAESISSQTRWAARLAELGVGHHACGLDSLLMAYVVREHARATRPVAGAGGAIAAATRCRDRLRPRLSHPGVQPYKQT